jgi:hypothetical protein
MKEYRLVIEHILEAVMSLQFCEKVQIEKTCNTTASPTLSLPYASLYFITNSQLK